MVVIVVVVEEVVVLTVYEHTVPVDVLPPLNDRFSFLRFSSSIFCEVISIVALLSRKRSSPTPA